MNEFKLSLYTFLGENPLHQYCTGKVNGRTARILLLGYGARMDQILETVLCCGQLPGTTLHAACGTPNPAGAADNLLHRCPDLSHFLRVTGKTGSAPREESSGFLGTLHFHETPMTDEGVRTFLKRDNRWGYIFISTGRDDKNLAIAKAAAAHSFGHPVCIAYVQKNPEEQITPASPLIRVKAISGTVCRDKLMQLEKTALNLHYIYAKTENDRADAESIEKAFREPSIYLTNIEAALHIESKLACCGISGKSPEEAARAFHALLREKPEIVDSLSAAEHKRWMMQKLLDGYRREETLGQVFQNGNTTHSSRDKWHCCLVTSDPTGQSRLTPEDWSCAPCNRRRDLDELDQLSLRLHDRCRELSEANADMVDAMLQALKVHINSLAGCPFAIQQEFSRLQFLILKMRQNKHSTVAMYDRSRRALRAMLEKVPSASSGLACSSLDTIHQGLAPLLAYISCRDFKAIDRQMVECIPFALTHRMSPSLMKLWSAKRCENVSSAWKLDARLLVYCFPAETEKELHSFRESWEEQNRFWAAQGSATKVRWLLCVPQQLKKTAEAILRPLPANVELLPAAEWSVEGLSALLSPRITENAITYIDITGADAMLTQAAYRSAEELDTSVFYTGAGQYRSLRKAEELCYAAPAKHITVQEMFLQDGAEIQSLGSSLYSDFSRKYLDLWDIAINNQHIWNRFCSDVSAAYSEYRSGRHLPSCPLLPSDAPSGAERRIRNVSFSAAEAILPLLRELEDKGCLKSVSAEKETLDGYVLQFQVNTKLADPEALEKFLQCCCTLNPTTHRFRLSEKLGRDELICENLEVKDISLAQWPKAADKDHPVTRSEGLRLLQLMAEADLLQNFRYDEEKGVCSFAFACKEVLECMQKSGTILEYMIYYTTLLDAHFYDVETSVFFRHSVQEDSPKNEIDVICTKNSSSLWISAKMVSSLERNFNYFMYEITLMGMQFGLNATPVLVSPNTDQFEIDPATGKRVPSQLVQRALGRGVYLVGRECFASGMLGEVLDRIGDGREDWCSFLPQV